MAESGFIPVEHPDETILVLDFGAQYSLLIARRVREFQVFGDVLPFDAPIEEVRKRRPKGILLSGGPASVYADGAPGLPPEIFELGVPILGICYGMQWMAHALGGRVERSGRREYGKAELEVAAFDDLFAGMEPATPEERFVAWMSHGDSIEALPEGFERIASTENTPYAAIRDRERRLYGVQFHPEVIHTPRGGKLLRNFVMHICRCEPKWTMRSYIEEAVDRIGREVGSEGRAVCGLSGGVDSTTAAVLVHRAIGDRLTSIFVDHGLLRAGEADEVMRLCRKEFGMRVVRVDARERFLDRLRGVADPERKRKIIGEEFIRVFEEEAERLGDVDFLVQGTLYPDVIESGGDGGSASVIKSHHNVGGLPDVMRLRLLEPLRLLFKDEVRRLGTQLQIPEALIFRQPFPGPGLAVRIIGEVSQDGLATLREADGIFTGELARAGLTRDVWQYFAVLTDTRTVGVMGDQRTYGRLVALRAITSEDGMTADWARLPYGLLDHAARRIANEVEGVSRVVYDITSKPPGTIEWE